jgi:hypothetical protein
MVVRRISCARTLLVCRCTQGTGKGGGGCGLLSCTVCVLRSGSSCVGRLAPSISALEGKGATWGVIAGCCLGGLVALAVRRGITACCGRPSFNSVVGGQTVTQIFLLRAQLLQTVGEGTRGAMCAAAGRVVDDAALGLVERCDVHAALNDA